MIHLWQLVKEQVVGHFNYLLFTSTTILQQIQIECGIVTASYKSKQNKVNEILLDF